MNTFHHAGKPAIRPIAQKLQRVSYTRDHVQNNCIIILVP